MNFLVTTLHPLLFITLVLFTLFAPATAEVASADAGYAYYWSLTFDYENNFNGRLHIDVGYNNNGSVQAPPLYGEDFNVTCQRVGNVSVGGGKATFNGGYLTCTLDVKTALERTFQTCNDKLPGCTMNIETVEKYRSFRMMANVTSPVNGSAPLFYHEDANYTISLAGSGAQIASTLTPLGLLLSSSQAAALNIPQFYASSYLCGPIAGCDMNFTINSVTESLPQGNDSVAFSTTPSTIYIGYNPDTGAIIPAGTQIAHLFIDPPNLGNH